MKQDCLRLSAPTGKEFFVRLCLAPLSETTGRALGLRLKRLAPSAATIAAAVDPAMTVVRAPNHIRAAYYTADHTSDDRPRRASDDGARARADGNAFQRSGLGHYRHCCQNQYEHSNLEHRAHDKSPWLISIWRQLLLSQDRPTVPDLKKSR